MKIVLKLPYILYIALDILSALTYNIDRSREEIKTMTNQSTTTNNTHNLNTTEEAKMTKTITHGTCGIEMTYHTDYIGVRNSDGAFLGNIYSADPAENWEEITYGACPICDGWEDGLGNECTAYGWELEDPNFAAGHGVANLVEGGWKYEDRDELKAEFGLSDFEADAYAQAIFELGEEYANV